jgi:hypothetical protein
MEAQVDRTNEDGARPGRCALAQRLERLVSATDIAAIDMTVCYSPQDLTRMLGCCDRTLDRRREKKLPPLWVPLEGLIRYPAWAFWSWLCSELRGHSCSFPPHSSEPQESKS